MGLLKKASRWSAYRAGYVLYAIWVESFLARSAKLLEINL